MRASVSRARTTAAAAAIADVPEPPFGDQKHTSMRVSPRRGAPRHGSRRATTRRGRKGGGEAHVRWAPVERQGERHVEATKNITATRTRCYENVGFAFVEAAFFDLDKT